VVGLLAVSRGSGTILELLGRVKHINSWLVLKTNGCSGWVLLDIGKSSCSEPSRYILNGLSVLNLYPIQQTIKLIPRATN
jgi:hypothetical protein